MEHISATEARASFSDVLNAVQKHPVVIRRQDKDVAVMISPEDYEKLRRVKVEELDELCARASAYAQASGLTEEKLAELLADES